jgi:hypothetical protein
MQWARRSISWTSFSSPWARARDSNRDVDVAVGRPIVPAHTGRGCRAESRTFAISSTSCRRSASNSAIYLDRSTTPQVSIEDLIANETRAVARIRWRFKTPGLQDLTERETIEIIRTEGGQAVEHWGAEAWSRTLPREAT